jgi:hypothetical protein
MPDDGFRWRALPPAGRAAERWYLGDGLAAPPTATECRAALLHQMPEPMPRYDRACALVGDDHLAHACWSLPNAAAMIWLA